MMRAKLFLAGVLLAVAAGVVAQDSVVPSKLRLRSLGVGTAASATAGTITTNTATSGVDHLVAQSGGTVRGTLRVTGSNEWGLCSGAGGSGHCVLVSNAGITIGGVPYLDYARQSAANTFTGGVQTFSGGGELLRLNENETNAFIAFWNQSRTVRQGYLESSNTGSMMTLAAEDGGAVRLLSDASVLLNAPSVTVNGSEVCRASGAGCPEQACGLMFSTSGPSIVQDTCDGTQTVASCGDGCFTLTHNFGAPVYNVVCNAAGNIGNANAQPFICAPSWFNSNTVQINTWNLSGVKETPPYNVHVVLVR